jgi:hypothetical protein
MIFFALLLSSLTSCMTIGFQQPQPAGKKSLDAFPSVLWGEYDDQTQGGKPELIISKHSVYLDGGSDVGEGVVRLGDTLVLKKFNGFYIASYLLPEEGYWVAHPFKTGPGELYLYSLDLKKEEAAGKLSPFTRIKKQGEDFILLDPSKKEFRKMLKNKELWEIETLYRIKK